MARRYFVPVDQVTFAMGTAADIVQLLGSAGKLIRPISYKLKPAQGTLPTAALIEVRCRFLPASVTQSGGTCITPQKLDPGDAAASFTAFINNTTKATTSGTAVVTDADGAHIFTGVDLMPTSPAVIGPSEAWVFELIAGTAQSVVCSGGVYVEELGG